MPDVSTIILYVRDPLISVRFWDTDSCPPRCSTPVVADRKTEILSGE